MATGGGFPRLKQSKSETKQRSNWQRSVSSDKDDSLSLTSFPSDIRINNWDLSDLRPSASADSRRRKKSKGNPEREREQSLSMDSPPHGEQKQRTPSSLSRTRNTPVAQRDALEKLKTKLTYEDDCSTDGEPNNERALPRSRRRLANNSQPEGATGGVASGSGRRQTRTNRNNNTESGPDSNQIVGRLVQIRDYIKQASAMMDTLQKSGDSGNAEDLAKVARLISNLREQEQGYLGLLHSSIAMRGDGADSASSDVPVRDGADKGDTDSEESVDVEVESDASETTNTSSSRPRIEDKLGLDSDDEKGSDNSKEEDTAMDNTMVAPGSAQALAARSVAETLNSLTQDREDPVGATGGSDVLTSHQRQQLMKIMMEKQEQLRRLQSRQEELLTMKREAEQRLQQAQARDNHARAALAAVEAGQAALAEDGDFLDQFDGPLKSNIVGYPDSDDDEASNARETDALAELQRQLNYLKNEFSAVPESGPRNNTETSGGAGRGRGGNGAAVTQGQRQQLEDKLQDLQEKKQSMDQLLQQLHTLRSQGLQGLNNAPPPRPQQPPPPPRQQQQRPRQPQPLPQSLPALPPDFDMSSILANLPKLAMAGLSTVAGGSGGGDEGGLPGLEMAEQGDANPLMSVVEAQEKLQKLQEVRQRLNQLRDLVQYYQKMKTQAEPDTLEQDEESTAADEQGAQSGSEATRALELPVNGAGAFMQIQGSQMTEPSEEQSDEDNASASGTEDWESGMGAWDEDPEVQEKIKKLMKAKDKLRNLQGLIADIEALPDHEQDLEELQKARNALRQRGHPPRGVEARLQDGGAVEGANGSTVSEGEVPALPREGEGATVPDGRLQQQMHELVRLKEERQRLLALQEQLESLQDQFPEEERVSDTETRTESSSVRKGEGDQPTASVVTFASNDELYSKMRDQRIQREELRSKKKELEAIMKKDQNRRQYFRNQDNQSDTVSYTTGTDAFGANASADATMATWGGSTVDNLENITEDEDGQDGAAPADDEDDGYPSDGIVQVEEEEEENETDNATYTIDADARQRRQARLAPSPRGHGARPKTARGRRGFPQPVRPACKKIAKKPQSQPWGRMSREERARARQNSVPALEDNSVEGDSAESLPLQQFQQQLQRMSSMCQNMMRTPATPAAARSQRQSNSNSQLAAFSAAESASSAGGVQAQLMREMQQQQLMMAVSQCNQQLMMQQFDMQALHRQIQQLSEQMSAIQQHASAPALMPTHLPADTHRAQQPVFVSQPQVIAAPYLSPLSSTLAAHVPNVATSVNVQSSRQTTFTVNPTFSGAFPADPQRLPVSQGVQTSDFDAYNEAQERTSRLRQHESQSQTSFPRPMRLWDETGEDSEKGPSETTVPRMNLQAFLKARRKKSARKRSSERSPQAQSEWQRLTGGGRAHRQTLYRPGLSAGISGSGFNDVASMTSVTSSLVEGAVGGQEAQARVGDLNLFEELRETIYTEVATLISQNESRPQYLISLFRELQSLTTDLMRQRAIFAIQEVVASFLLKENTADTQEAWQPWKAGQDVTSELTPSESMPTSDDDEVKARVRQHASALERKKQREKGLFRGNSLKNDKFDYAENALTTSSLSTPTNDVGESPFSRDSLGETVIHLDKALAKMRREMQQADRERAERVREAMESRPETGGDLAAADQGSESSVSDMPYPRIDAQELDQQIKGVMGQVIPVIKEHINDVCSPQLLAYIQRLVLSLVRQPGHTHEFARFFYGQLSSILQDSLGKFEGRRVRECGEDLLLDMSEVLFNELAFLRIMKDLDDPAAVERMRNKSWFSPSSSKNTQAGMVGEDYDAVGSESDNEASDDKDDDITPQDIRVNGVDEEEEEELGKDRDDELARKMMPQSGDDKEEDTEDLFTTSEVHIQLAMSETKPFTRIGSDEDTDGSDESLSLEDPSDTAVSRNEMMEHRQNNLRTSTSATSSTAAPSAVQPKEAAMAEREEKEADTSEADGTLEASGTADGSRGNGSVMNTASSAAANGADGVEAVAGDGCGAVSGGDGVAAAEEKAMKEVQMNGEVGLAEEEVAVGMEDLPSVLNVTDPDWVEQRRQEEEAGMSGINAVLNSMDTGEELAGDGSALKEPGSEETVQRVL